MDSLGVVELVLSLCERIYNMVARTKTNKQQCLNLAERVKGLEDLVLTIVERRETRVSRIVHNALKDLSKSLISAKELMVKFSRTKTLKAFLKSDSHEEKFREVNEKLSHSFQVLSGALQVEHGAILHKVYKHVARPEDEQRSRSSTPLMSPPIPSPAVSPSTPSPAVSPPTPSPAVSPPTPSPAVSPSTPSTMMSPATSMFQPPPPIPVQDVMRPRQVSVTSMYQIAAPMAPYNLVTPGPLIASSGAPVVLSVPGTPGTYRFSFKL